MEAVFSAMNALLLIEEAEENGTPVLRKVKAEDVPPAIREKLGG